MNDFATAIGIAALACAAAIAFVLMLRKPMHRFGGAGAAYALWLLVPIASFASVLPRPARIVIVELAPTVVRDGLASGGALPTDTPVDAGTFDVAAWLIGAWIAGVLVCGIVFFLQQRRFRRSLGRLQAIDGDLHRAQTTCCSPAVVGVWRSRIVVPADFERRYDARERDLILAHERHHRARGDARINALAASLRGLFWFNPLVHFAAAKFLVDQELACDAAVMARFPSARRPYASAMLKTQLGHFAAPLGCQWHSASPLMERILMLKNPPITRRHRWLGSVAAASLTVSGSIAAWAIQPATAQTRYIYAPVLVAKAELDLNQIADLSPSFASDGHRDSVTPAGENASARQHETSPATRLASRAHADLDSRPHAQSERIALMTDGNRHDDAVSISPGASTPDRSQETDGHALATTQLASSNEQRPAQDHNAREIPSYRIAHPPRYPAAAVRQHLEGQAVLNVHVDARGYPTSVDVASLSPSSATELASAGIAAIMQWRFEPASRADHPIAGEVAVPFSFSLQGDGAYAAAEVQHQASYRAVTAIGNPENKIGGVVYVRARVEADGAVSSTRVDHVDPPAATALASAALAGVKTWTFHPARDGTRDVASTVLVPVVFRAEAQTPAPIARNRMALEPIEALPSG